MGFSAGAGTSRHMQHGRDRIWNKPHCLGGHPGDACRTPTSFFVFYSGRCSSYVDDKPDTLHADRAYILPSILSTMCRHTMRAKCVKSTPPRIVPQKATRRRPLLEDLCSRLPAPYPWACALALFAATDNQSVIVGARVRCGSGHIMRQQAAHVPIPPLRFWVFSNSVVCTPGP